MLEKIGRHTMPVHAARDGKFDELEMADSIPMQAVIALAPTSKLTKSLRKSVVQGYSRGCLAMSRHPRQQNKVPSTSALDVRYYTLARTSISAYAS